MFNVINKDGGIWGTFETKEEAAKMAELKGFTVESSEKKKEVKATKKK